MISCVKRARCSVPPARRRTGARSADTPRRCGLHHADAVGLGARLRIVLHVGQKHRFHFGCRLVTWVSEDSSFRPSCNRRGSTARQHASEVGRCQVVVREAEVGVVGDVEHFGAELDAHLVRRLEIFLAATSLRLRIPVRARHCGLHCQLSGLGDGVRRWKADAADPLIRRMGALVRVAIRSGRLE